MSTIGGEENNTAAAAQPGTTVQEEVAAAVTEAAPTATAADVEQDETARPPERLKTNEKKWGRETMTYGFVLLPALLVRFQHRLGLDPVDMNILLHLVDHWWEAEGKPFPSKQRIAERMNVSGSTIQRHVTKLQQQGLLQREDRFGGRKQQLSNVYHLEGLVSRLKEIAAEEAKVRAARATEDERRSRRSRSRAKQG